MKLAIALSGGGHRATLFALGVMQYLADAGRNPDIVSVASVSGGSITNGVIAQRVDLEACDGAAFEREVTAPLALRVARQGTLFGTRWTWAYVAVLALCALATLIVPWRLAVETHWRVALFVIGVVFTALIAWQRGNVCAAAFRRTLFSPPGGAACLADIERSVAHVLCATDLRTARAIYLSPRFVYGYGLGWSDPGPVELHRAVQASACFPGGFPPASLACTGLTFRRTHDDSPVDPQPERLLLVDGGVYDNMADQWARGLGDRLARWPSLREMARAPDALVVVNAAARREWTPFHARLPVWNEIAALARDMNVLYENTTAVRRQDLVERFDAAERDGRGLRGALVMIRQSPYDLAGFFASGSGAAEWPERATRAQAVLEALAPEGREAWEAITRESCKVPTTLSALGTDTSATLMRHGYVLAMANLHVVLDLPLLAVPSVERFRKLAGAGCPDRGLASPGA